VQHTAQSCIMQNDPTSENLVVRLAPEVKAELRRLAKADHRTLSDYVRFHLTKLVELEQVAS
jgi:predicted DNA-binding protein